MPTEEQRLAMQGAWRFRGGERPPFAAAPGPNQESVWDYPRPPVLEASTRHVRVVHGNRLIAETRQAQRLLETASPPTFYLPPDDTDLSVLVAVRGGSFCEWKGRAQYWDVVVEGRRMERAAWAYPEAGGEFAVIAGYIAFYPGHLHCSVDGEAVRAQPGGFYGGWVTDDIVGPFKGEPGTGNW